MPVSMHSCFLHGWQPSLNSMWIWRTDSSYAVQPTSWDPLYKLCFLYSHLQGWGRWQPGMGLFSGSTTSVEYVEAHVTPWGSHDSYFRRQASTFLFKPKFFIKAVDWGFFSQFKESFMRIILGCPVFDAMINDIAGVLMGILFKMVFVWLFLSCFLRHLKQFLWRQYISFPNT